MARIISIVNQKGGVGKTTTAVSLAASLAAAGKFVLLIDLDPQANATSGLGLKYQEITQGTYQALLGTSPAHSLAVPVHIDTLHILPATADLAGANVELVGQDNREFKLHEALIDTRHRYDFILIDCPPSLGLLTLNGIVAADEILIPVQTEYYALEGLGQLLETIELVKTNLKPELKILGAVLTMYDKRNGLSEAVFQELYKYFPNKIFRSVIPRNVRLAEAPSHGQPIGLYDSSSPGARAYERLAREVMEES